MININKKLVLGVLLASLTLTTACNDILDEEPKGIYTPEDFYTERGIQQGVTALYRHLRLLYGNGYYMSTTMGGTDELTYAQSADNNFKDLDFSGVGNLTPSSFPSSMVWAAVFPYINTANGIIQNGPTVGIKESLISEARFFRAFDYFLLVQTYGGVPLDLGSGDLKFNISASTSSKRNTVSEVYTKAIFPDLLTAIDNLPVSPRVTGGVTKNVARLYLAKAYLTYAWWLQNPNNIPTYPETSRTDPNGQSAQWYFQQAYDVALEAINNPGPYALQPTYYDVNLGANDRNSETMLYADHTQSSSFYNEGDPFGFASGWSPDNFATWISTWNYTNIRSSSSATSWTAVSSVQRAATQDLGRPWTRMAPTIEAIKNTFADKTHDSRFDGTFQMVFRANWDKAGLKDGNGQVYTKLYNANNLEIHPGDAVLSFLSDDSQADNIIYPIGAGKSNVGAGELPGRADFVIHTSGISRIAYPSLWKLGTYRTDDPNGLGYPNAGLTRPGYAAKFSEFYLIAAEAAVKGAAGAKSARELVNVLRARAGKWRWDNNGNIAKNIDFSAEMIAATPASIDIDYILAERSREFYGEGYRWYDLVRTQRWEQYAKTYSIGGNNYGNHSPQVVNRNIQAHHYLRPIPQSQFDYMEMSAAEEAAYQNPGY
ncbi:RagB/SusD family nutrient uptake outer membrane protein [Chryseobacterium sp. POL2]|uniref:RagB/SusD family nutrient uptake outer membrane protein n=1 Tax=Chryseobacterium sp. POL2 TaxID=2713414 RepID=UPI0013E1DAF8|nr:RagB/SusD family nutrient uptake outer membrane protein [Chryseobacterium sp. POL2]QIG88317.1 RagB/SusD family nutrient uptake outer membrane protein [Chryseobacterium sp. POL2]